MPTLDQNRFWDRYNWPPQNAACIDFCVRRFADLANASFQLTDGRSLRVVPADSVHFIWSYDSFVHIEPDITGGYLAEFARVLAPGGTCTIHHPGAPDERQRAVGGRSEVTKESFARLAQAHGLQVVSQVDSWGPGNRSNKRVFGDCITTIAVPT